MSPRDLCDEAKSGQILISPRVLIKVENAVKVEPISDFESALSILPLDRTTHRGRLRLWTVTSVSDLFHRLEQVAARIC
jgi:hypothetical protein